MEDHFLSFYSYKKEGVGNNIYILGKKEMKHLSENCFENYYVTSGTLIPVFYRLQIKKEIFYSAQYRAVKVRNSFTVYFRCTDGSETYGEIMYFAILDHCAVAVVRKFTVLLPIPEFQPTLAILQVKRTDILHVVHVTNIIEKLVCIDIDVDKTYVCKFPCSVHFD